MERGAVSRIKPVADVRLPAISKNGQRPTAMHRATSSFTMTPELMAEAVWRLGRLGLIYAGGDLVAHFGRRLLLAWTHSVVPGFHLGDVLALVAMAMGVAIYIVSRRGLLPPKQLLDLGLLFNVGGALGFAAQFLSDNPTLPETSGPLISAECVWIVIYPLVVPNTPRKVLIASVIAASMGPAAFALSRPLDHASLGNPLLMVSFFLPNYTCAIVAYLVAQIVHRFNVQLKHAREIGSYELVEPIGEGGMGEVWRAKHQLLARPAAIKLIRKTVLGSSPRARDAIVRRFEQEAQETALLGSPHTIEVHDFGVTEEGDFYYVMELLNGISLERFVELFGPMEPDRVAYLLQQVCHSLAEAHARCLVHRDIKPANIFMCRLGPDFDFVKVLDFGLVKHLGAEGGQMLTVEGTTAGTPPYMAPEIALGRQDVDGRADLYSLACVAYFLLTGQPVFSGDTPMATALAHVNEPPVAPSLRSEFDIPPALERLILDCLAKDPAARPASARVVAGRLAATVPHDSWSSETAERWWALHHRLLDSENNSVTAAAEQPQPAAEDHPKCWPRLDPKVAPKQFV
jgi:serine/threonine-protein kinase